MLEADQHYKLNPSTIAVPTIAISDMAVAVTPLAAGSKDKQVSATMKQAESQAQ